MTTVRCAEAKSTAAPAKGDASATTSPAGIKARQTAKIQELGQALIDAGLLTLDKQADALGLSRSTAWTILKAAHKSSGLSAIIIERMLASPALPPRAHSILMEYVAEKSFGLYGGSRRQQQRFAVRLLKIIDPSPRSQEAKKANGETRIDAHNLQRKHEQLSEAEA